MNPKEINLVEVVRPETYRVIDEFGNSRRYRRNVPSVFADQNQTAGQNYQTVSLTTEDDFRQFRTMAKCGMNTDGGDEPPCGAINDEDDDDTYQIDFNEKHRQYSTSITVAKDYFKHIIGRQAEMKRRLENQTRTKIDVPRIGQDGPIVISGIDRACVATCRRRVELLVDAARQRQPFTHFLSIPFNSDDIKVNFENFKQGVAEECADSRGVDASIFITPERLHLTIGMLVLLSNEERTLARQTLEQCKEEVIMPHLQNVKLPLKACLENLSYMNDDPSEVNVLYANVAMMDSVGVDVLQSLANKIVDYFVRKNVMPKKQYESVKLHVTLMNTRYRSSNENDDDIDDTESTSGTNKSNGGGGGGGRRENRERETFDATKILERFHNYDFGQQIINEVHISQRHAHRVSDGYYTSTAMIELCKEK